jgi:hypothetical protein
MHGYREAAALRSRRKGLRRSACAQGFQRLPAGHDLEVQVGDRPLKLEVNSRSDFSTLHRWLDGADALVLCADRKAPLVVLALSLAAEIAKPRELVKLVATPDALSSDKKV